MRKKILPILICCSAFLIVWIVLAYFLANNLIVKKPLDQADAILVLSGSSVYRERTQEAAVIFKKGVAPKIFLTDDGGHGGWNQSEQRNPSFAELERKELIEQGVPEKAIEILPTIVNGTEDEANLLAQVAAERKLNSLLLITSAYHSRRTLWTFERAISKNNLTLSVGIQSPPTGLQTPRQWDWWLSLDGWKIVGGEYLKIVYYRGFY